MNKEISELTEDDPELLNRKVAVIAGWTDIKTWDSNALKKTLVGTNLAHPEMGIFVPDYVGSLDAISNVFKHLDLFWSLTQYKDFTVAWSRLPWRSIEESTPAIALCKLLIAINPDPIKPILKPESVNSVEGTEIVEASFT